MRDAVDFANWESRIGNGLLASERYTQLSYQPVIKSNLPNLLSGAQIRKERACGVQGERTPECGGESTTWQARACCHGKWPHDFETGQTTGHRSENEAVTQTRMREATRN